MNAKKITAAAGVSMAAAVGLTFGLSSVMAASAPQVSSTTPAGITLVEVVRELVLSQPEFLWYRPGDAVGHTLLTSSADAPGVSKCVGDCAKEFPPLLASAGAKTTADWSLVKREDGAQQWAYKSRPLYTWTKEEEPGEVATAVGVSEVSNSKLAEGAVKVKGATPPQGWQVARFEPSMLTAVPDGIDARVVSSAQAVTLTDFNGLTLYAFDGDAKKDGQVCSSASCDVQWVPVVAPQLAANVGAFSVITRADSTKQWAYNNKPLYRFKTDTLPGDVHGEGVDKRWNVALLSQNYHPTGVTIDAREGYGETLAVNGMTLYTGIAYEARWGGRDLRDNYRNAYFRGKRLGGETCVSAQCLASWKPFRPADDAQSQGFWEVITRTDGTKQWAYKGYALYTHAGDKVAGQMNGNDVYDIIADGSADSYKQASFLVSVNGRAGVFWHIAKP